MSDDRFEPVTFEDVSGEHETDRGLLVRIDGETAWLPKSQLSDDSEVRRAGDKGDLVIPRWLAEDKGLV